MPPWRPQPSRNTFRQDLRCRCLQDRCHKPGGAELLLKVFQKKKQAQKEIKRNQIRRRRQRSLKRWGWYLEPVRLRLPGWRKRLIGAKQLAGLHCCSSLLWCCTKLKPKWFVWGLQTFKSASNQWKDAFLEVSPQWCHKRNYTTNYSNTWGQISAPPPETILFLFFSISAWSSNKESVLTEGCKQRAKFAIYDP